MRRLRALLSARPARSPARPGVEAAGRVDRRRLLGLLGAAPSAAPALARAALAPEPFSARVVDWTFVDVGAGPRTAGFGLLDGSGLVVDRVDLVADMGERLERVSAQAAIERAAEAEIGLFPDHRLVRGNPAAGVLPRLVCLPKDAAFLLIDDAGSGP